MVDPSPRHPTFVVPPSGGIALRNRLKPELRTARQLLSAVVVFLFLAGIASAHGVHIAASVDGKTIHGRATFQGGTPMKNVSVTAHDAADQVLTQTKTDDDGQFSLEAAWRCDYHLEVETADGHGGDCIVKASLLPSNLPARENLPSAEDSAAKHGHSHAAPDTGDENPWTVEQIRNIQAKLNILQEKLDAQNQSLRVRDILGGIGYILGVFGLYAIAVNYFKKRSA